MLWLVLQVSDPYWEDVSNFAYQGLQPHQDAVVQAAEMQLGLLKKAVGTAGMGNGKTSKPAVSSKGRVSPGPGAAVGC